MDRAFLAAVSLLEHWGPVGSQVDGPAWRVRAIHGHAPKPSEQQWPPPSLADVNRYGRFPETFTHANRYPVAVEPLNRWVSRGPGVPWESARPVAEIAQKLTRLLSGTFERAPGALHPLIEHIAQRLAGEMRDLLRLTVVAEPDGLALTDEVHLLGRNLLGGTFRLSLAPAASLPTPDGTMAVPRSGWNVRPLSHRPGRDELQQAVLTDRAACAAELLGDLAMLTNNDPMRIEITVEEHGLTLDETDLGTAEDTIRTWWPQTTRWTELRDDWEDTQWWEDTAAATPERIDHAAMARFRAGFEEHNLALARSTAWAKGRIGDYDPDDEPQPRFPGDQLVTLLGRDLFDTVTTQVTGSPDQPPMFTFGIGLPHEITPTDIFRGHLLFVGTQRIAIMTIEAYT